jgi:hypothetical protein
MHRMPHMAGLACGRPFCGRGGVGRQLEGCIDAAIVAAHQVAIRGKGVNEDFRVPAPLPG